MYPLKTRQKYDPTNLAASANTFTTVYLGNYVSGDFSEWHGSHPGVDVVPMAPNSELYACLDGIVKKSALKADEGEYIVIEHPNAPDPADPTKKTTLVSCYLHLSERFCEVGDIVNEGDVIGKTGNTGNSTGEHLHFQIDRVEAPFHPYWPFTFAESSAAGLSFFEAVNQGLGLENAKKYTVNPFVYLDSLGSVSTTTTTTVSAEVTTTHTTVANEIISNPPAASLFADVLEGSAYDAAVKYLVEKGVLDTANTNFRPNDSISRVELLKMIFLEAGISVGNDMTVSFSDLQAGAWYIPYINTAKLQQIVGWYADGTFKPNNPVSRAEAAKIILIAKKVEIDSDTSLPAYTDVSTDAWYAAYAQAVKLGNLLDSSDGQFHPNTPITRWEVAEFLYRLAK